MDDDDDVPLGRTHGLVTAQRQRARLLEKVALRYIDANPGCGTLEIGQLYHLRTYKRVAEPTHLRRRNWASRIIEEFVTRKLVTVTVELNLDDNRKVAGGRYLAVTLTGRGRNLIRSKPTPEEQSELAALPPLQHRRSRTEPQPQPQPRTKRKEEKMPEAKSNPITDAIEAVLKDGWVVAAKDAMDENDLHELVAIQASKRSGANVTREQVNLHMHPPPPPPALSGPSVTDLAAGGLPGTAEEALKALVVAIAGLANTVQQLATNTTQQLDRMSEALELMALTPCHERQPLPAAETGVPPAEADAEPAATATATTPAAAAGTEDVTSGPSVPARPAVPLMASSSGRLEAYQDARLTGVLPGR